MQQTYVRTRLDDDYIVLKAVKQPNYKQKAAGIQAVIG